MNILSLPFLIFAVSNVSAATIIPVQIEQSPQKNPEHQNYGEPTFGLQLSIDFTKPTFLLGEAVIATVTLKNVGDQNSSPIQSLWFEYDYRLFITRNQGQAVSLLPQKGTPVFGSARPFTIPKGSEAKFNVQLDSLYDFTAAGEYLVTIARGVPEPLPSKYKTISVTNRVDRPGGGFSEEVFPMLIPEPFNARFSEIKSGNAIIRIVENPASAINEVTPSATNNLASSTSSNAKVLPRTNSSVSGAPDASAPPPIETSLEKSRHMIGWSLGGAVLLLIIIFYRARKRQRLN